MTTIDEPPQLNLDYDDPLAQTVPVQTVIGLARRHRARRRVATAALVAAIAAGAVATITGLPQFTRPGRSANDQVLASLAGSQHRPADQPVIVDVSHPGWTSFVYVSGDDQICGGTIGNDVGNDGPLSVTCWISLDQAKTGIWVTLPVFQVLPPVDQDGRVLAIGLVRGAASTIEVTFKNHVVTTTTVPVPVHGVAGLSAYPVWLPIDGASSYGTNDIQHVIARDTAGNVVTQLPLTN